MGLRFRLLVWLMLSLVVLVACSGSDPARSNLVFDEYGAVLGLHVAAAGIVTFEVAEGVTPPAPLGMAERDEILNPTAYYEVPNTLTIRLDDTEYFYDLHDVLFRLEYESPVYEVFGLVRYGKDLIVEIVPGERNANSVTLIPVRERVTVGDTEVLLDYLELGHDVIRIFFDATQETTQTAPRPGLDPTTSCMLRIDPGPLGLGVDESTTFEAQAVISPEQPTGTTRRGYAEFPRSLLQKGYEYEFRYACAEQYRFELPLRFE